MVKNGYRRQKQQYRCLACGYQFRSSARGNFSVLALYRCYAIGKQTLVELSELTGYSIRTIWQVFDELEIEPHFPETPEQPVNLIVDATFFGQNGGVLVFRADQKNLYWRIIEDETVHEMKQGLDALDKRGYQFKSITLDGKQGMRQLFEQRYPDLPIQFCQFHQAQIIRRYVTQHPKSACSKELNGIMACLTDTCEETFRSLLEAWAELYHDFLSEKNDQGQLKHRRLRSAWRSLKSHLPYLFTYKNHPELKMPNTTNSCEGSFAHWKQKIKIHRGLKKHRRDKMTNFLLSQQKK